MLENRNGRPTRAKVEAASVSTAIKDGSTLPLRSDALADLDSLAAHVDGTFVVVVKVNTGRYRRRCYLTAKAAENAASKATERGETATVYLAELKPLWRVVA